jgi:hypothetical protein
MTTSVLRVRSHKFKFWKCVGIYCVKKGSCLRVFDIILRQKWIKWPIYEIKRLQMKFAPPPKRHPQPPPNHLHCFWLNRVDLWYYWSFNSHFIIHYETFQTELFNHFGNWYMISLQKISPSFSKHFVVKSDDHVSQFHNRHRITSIAFGWIASIYDTTGHLIHFCRRIISNTLKQGFFLF